MKNLRKTVAGMGLMLAATILPATAQQKIDEARMERDIAVAENVLTTLIKQQINNQRTFFPLEVNGSYQAGYGVTFNLPADFTTPIAFMNSDNGGRQSVMIYSDGPPGVENFRFDSHVNDENDVNEENEENEPATAPRDNNSIRLATKMAKRKTAVMDSLRDAFNEKVLEASKTFVLDYGDMISQLGANERIVITNAGQRSPWVNHYFNAPKRLHLSVEAMKSDVAAYRQGKITREQALAKLKIVNTETVEAVEPDMELLSSIFNRLYSVDLSKTFFIQQSVYFERLKDFGSIYYMQVFSSSERDGYNTYVMPTLRLEGVDQATRDKKVKELYPVFEKDLKDNILEYGRTLKSLKDNESLIFQVKLTRCAGCGIPSSLELSLKASDLKDFSAGKLDKAAMLSRFVVKKGELQ